jgi:3',5'-cyclic AMP phosphodiesterase CpdA
MPPPFRFAVIADAHVHDPAADFGLGTDAPHGLALRPLAEVARVPRLFNETAALMDDALAGAWARGATDVVLLGDYTDDGQVRTTARLAALLDRHRRAGLRIHALPGNHDLFAEDGRHRTRRLLSAAGGHVTVTSDPARTDPTARRVIHDPGMYCPGYAPAMAAMAPFGYMPRPADLHWETPFGTSPDPATRRAPITARDGATAAPVTDASYLLEPVPGIWFLMLDANVFLPHDTRDRASHAEPFADPSDAGWTAALRHKPWLVAWVADVARRARASGKRLLTFSHYPMTDPRGGTAEERAIGPTALTPRIPAPEIAAAMKAAGVGVHFSGHLHMAAVSIRHSITEVAAPSLAAYPGGWLMVTLDDHRLTVETVPQGDLPMPSPIPDAYRAEVARSPDSRLDPLAGAETLGDLMTAQTRLMVTRRHLRRDWRLGAGNLPTGATLADVAAMAGPVPAGLRQRLSAVTAAEFLQDWAMIRSGGTRALADIPAGRTVLAAALADHLAASQGPSNDDAPGRYAALCQALFDRIAVPSAGFSMMLPKAG